MLAQGLFVHTLSSVTGTTILSAPLVQFDQSPKTKQGVLTISASEILEKETTLNPRITQECLVCVFVKQQSDGCITSPVSDQLEAYKGESLFLPFRTVF